MTEQSLDVVVVGGGPAGLSPALILGRVRPCVLLPIPTHPCDVSKKTDTAQSASTTRLNYQAAG